MVVRGGGGKKRNEKETGKRQSLRDCTTAVGGRGGQGRARRRREDWASVRDCVAHAKSGGEIGDHSTLTNKGNIYTNKTRPRPPLVFK